VLGHRLIKLDPRIWAVVFCFSFGIVGGKGLAAEYTLHPYNNKFFSNMFLFGRAFLVPLVSARSQCLRIHSRRRPHYSHHASQYNAFGLYYGCRTN